MAETSTIEWTDATWNPITGCSVLSPGCKHCYAMKLAGTRLQHHPSRAGLTVPTKEGPVWNGEVRLNEAWLDQPLQWRRPRNIFVCAHSDLWHEAVPDAWIDKVFARMALASHHTFQVLSKRSGRMRAYFAGTWKARVIDLLEEAKPSALWNGAVFQAIHELETKGFLPNVWIGVSAEDQPRFDDRVPDLEACPAAVRFLSLEPLLGSIDAKAALARGLIHWVIAGGESGDGARPTHPGWVDGVLAACEETGVAFFFKQWGGWLSFDRNSPSVGYDELTGSITVRTDGRLYSERAVIAWILPYPAVAAHVGKKVAGRQLRGRTYDAMPAVRQ